MFRAYKFITSLKTSSINNRNIPSMENGYKNILNYSKKTFFKKTNMLSLAAAKKDYYSKFFLYF